MKEHYDISVDVQDDNYYQPDLDKLRDRLYGAFAGYVVTKLEVKSYDNESQYPNQITFEEFQRSRSWSSNLRRDCCGVGDIEDEDNQGFHYYGGYYINFKDGCFDDGLEGYPHLDVGLSLDRAERRLYHEGFCCGNLDRKEESDGTV